MYVIADENDVIKLRSNHRKDLVYVYPIKTTTEKAQLLFLDMVQRANDVSANPEFYNTLTNTCTTILCSIFKRFLHVSCHSSTRSIYCPRIQTSLHTIWV